MNEEIYTVSKLNRYIKNMFEENIFLNDIKITGEITNFKAHYTGHLYFTIKDETSSIKCVMFKGNTYSLKFKPEDGLKVIISGSVSIYEANGTYQIYVKQMEPDGLGALYLAYEQLKAKLEAEGLFDKSHKKELPFIPKRVGVITSKTGAVIRDIINVTTRRYNKPNILIFPASTQGVNVASSVIEGIKTFNKMKNVDVIIIARGGGSFEELFGFNDENLAREIYASDIPIISAVGHETDFTICDFVSDLRVPTPSAAGEVVYPKLLDLQSSIDNNILRQRNAINSYITRKRDYINRLKSYKIEKEPLNLINSYRIRIDNNLRIAQNNMSKIYNDKSKKASSLIVKLDALSPLKTLERGYSIVHDESGKVINSPKDVKVNDKITVTLKDGKIDASVI